MESLDTGKKVSLGLFIDRFVDSGPSSRDRSYLRASVVLVQLGTRSPAETERGGSRPGNLRD